jgi:hypothetical protein
MNPNALNLVIAYDYVEIGIRHGSPGNVARRFSGVLGVRHCL